MNGPSSTAPAHSPGRATLIDEIAVVVPVYMGSVFLDELCERLSRTLATITPSYSIVLVDDRGPDNAWPKIQDIGRRNPHVKGIQLSRNFGQHYALTAGIDHARARWYVVMDCDLQDAPEDIPLLYEKAREGCDIVVGLRDKEGHPFLKRAISRLFYRAFNTLAGFELDWSVGNYRIFSDRVADGFRQMREQMRFFPASLSFMGFDVGTVNLPHHPRAAGQSSYTFRKLAKLALDTILAHSEVPLKLVAMFGLGLSVISVLAGLAFAVLALAWDVAVPGWASLIVSIFVLGGVQIFITGVVGIYVGKCFDESKKRPLYFVRDTSNF